ncbi:HAD family hydrolase [Streptomyces chartreusis]|uniref:HAD-IA family hydrolase n=1 Tax=Streptomyces chartreusis TaxID=1969 RepID=A0A7H8T2P1_STRCX|nr:HAD-IA family hydrolase [Streptomyces chartreusis]QKZ17332.1 HAD-IA family hydrolase [Streptomyces chartreusis]
MTVKGVIFDFAGTLFRHDRETGWLEGVPASTDAWDAEEREAFRTRFAAPAQLSNELPPEARAAWEKRDLHPVFHRAAYLSLLQAAGAREPGLSELLYQRLIDPMYWKPYQDTCLVLRKLNDMNIPVVVASNIAWDIRTVFDLHSVTHLISSFLMSYVEGTTKPDPQIFLTACERMGIPPQDALMVGDDEQSDGGAAALGIQVKIVSPLHPNDRSGALLGALAAHGLV